MHQQIVLDSTGDARHRFDPEDVNEVAAARRRYEGFIARGYYAFDKKDGRRLDRFDTSVEDTLFVPRLKGG